MYTEIGQVSEATVADLRNILLEVTWWKRWEQHISDITNHHAFSCVEQIKKVKGIIAQWPVSTFNKATFLRLPPGGKLYRHHDEGIGYTIPIETNIDCVSMSYEDGTKKESHLDVGKIYYTNRAIEHESVNNGKTNRTHLIVMLKGE